MSPLFDLNIILRTVGVILFALTALAVPWLAYRVIRPVSVDRYLESPWMLYILALISVGGGIAIF